VAAAACSEKLEKLSASLHEKDRGAKSMGRNSNAVKSLHRSGKLVKVGRRPEA